MSRSGAVEFDERRVDAIFKRLASDHLPGAAVGIAINGQPVYRKGFGLASMELPVVLSPTIRMRIGSTTKHFAALAYLLLCEEGRAQIDDSIGRYVPELHPVSREVTMRQLMTHTSGLRDVFEICWQFSGAGHLISSEEQLSLYSQIDDVNAPPGTTWIYNNGGYLLLSMAIERIADRPLEEVLKERILLPVGMRDTQLRRTDRDFHPNSATLHMTSPTGGFEKLALGTSHTGEGGLVSSVDDLLRWLAHLDAPVVGAPLTWETMKTPQRLANGTSTGYGLGLIVDEYRGVETLSHPGGVLGGNIQMLKVPSAGLDVVVATNRHDLLAMRLVNEILDACLPGLEKLPVPDREVLSGIFSSPTTGRVIQLTAKDGRQMVSIDGFDLPCVRDGRSLRPTPEYSSLKQRVLLDDASEGSRSLTFDDFGTIDTLVELPALRGAQAAPILGRYRSDSTDTEATILQVQDALRIRTVSRFGSLESSLTCLNAGIWRMTPLRSLFPLGGVLWFAKDGGGFGFSSARLWALPFRRIE